MAVFKPENVEDFYEIGEVLGKGHFGQVRQVCERATGSCWAGKFLKIRRSACSRLGLDRSTVEQEVEILQAVQHPNVVALKDVFESRAEVVLILELVENSSASLRDLCALTRHCVSMKTVILALFVLLAVSQSEALRCKCGGQKICSGPVETCYGSNNVCASVVIYAGSRPTWFKGCSSSSQCMLMNVPGVSSASCCRTDLCNR